MLGMFMILPVFALYAEHLPQAATPMQVGLAIGLYGLVQACLQIPLGMWSDRIGRKPVIVLGLVIFSAGSFIAGHAEEIHWILLGRAVQGAGAISGAVSALLSDVTRPQVRTQAMAVMGAGMGLAFVIALILGPIVSGLINVDGIFDLTGVLALLAVPAVLFLVPDVPVMKTQREGLMKTLLDGQLLRLDGGVFMLHATMTMLFIAAPQALVDTLHLPSAQHWQVYLPVLLLSLLPVFPLIRRIEARGAVKRAFLGAIGLLALALLTASELHGNAIGLWLALFLFFAGFNYLEGTLPSLISRRAPPEHKGAALGVYASSQFLGGFIGGTLGGFASGHWGVGGTFAVAACLPLIWFTFAVTLQPPPSLRHLQSSSGH
ncbi:Predicted arabinose efflux permease, MFS family [Solimonas aquatica]|uniref:Predicted arabinose efflux permease, MFS family n=2 Tax=Solimonas aquatica TaxID=489703 RepID=A0A1H9L4Z1_9GAMM|nr:Predicted arabinose efflux permease, MFS family [Solimonas aquatica]